MKTLTLTIVLALIATFSYAQFPQSSSPDSCCYNAEDLRAAIYLGSPEMVFVKMAKKVGDKVKLRVKENNQVLYQKNYKKWALVNVKYNVSEFPEGAYVFEIIQNKEVVYSHTIQIRNDETLSLR